MHRGKLVGPARSFRARGIKMNGKILKAVDIERLENTAVIATALIPTEVSCCLVITGSCCADCSGGGCSGNCSCCTSISDWQTTSLDC